MINSTFCLSRPLSSSSSLCCLPLFSGELLFNSAFSTAAISIYRDSMRCFLILLSFEAKEIVLFLMQPLTASHCTRGSSTELLLILINSSNSASSSYLKISFWSKVVLNCQQGAFGFTSLQEKVHKTALWSDSATGIMSALQISRKRV